MATYDTSDFRPKLKIEIEGVPFRIVSSQFVKPGKGVAFYKVKMKNLLTGGVQERNFRSGDKVDVPDINEAEMEFLYADGDGWHFMDQKTYEQVAIQEESLTEVKGYLKESTVCQIMFYRGKPIDIEPPNFVTLKVAECPPAVRGDTVSGATKEATMETGLKLHVPLFINQEDMVRIDTRTGEYLDRQK